MTERLAEHFRRYTQRSGNERDWSSAIPWIRLVSAGEHYRHPCKRYRSRTVCALRQQHGRLQQSKSTNKRGNR